jgi:hypothetical protein
MTRAMTGSADNAGIILEHVPEIGIYPGADTPVSGTSVERRLPGKWQIPATGYYFLSSAETSSDIS